MERLLDAVDGSSDDGGDEDKDTTVRRLISDLEGGSSKGRPSAEAAANVSEGEEEGGRACDDLDLSRFESLLGLYDVSYVAKTNENENPVGGKWTRNRGGGRNGGSFLASLMRGLLKTRGTYQHLLPPPPPPRRCDLSAESEQEDRQGGEGNAPAGSDDAVVAEAVNVVSLDALFGLLSILVVLRGDAVPLSESERSNNEIPLSDLAVRAFFDPPRIALSLRDARKRRNNNNNNRKFLNLSIGPTSSVVLDTTYADDKVRIGMGGTSGTKFVFRRLSEKEQESDEVIEFRSVLERKPLGKVRAAAAMVATTAAGLYCSAGPAIARKTTAFPIFLRILGSGFAALGLVGLALVCSSGGIERDDVSYRAEKKAREAVAKE